MRLLLVEDDPLIRMSLAAGLAEHGFEIAEALSAEMALDMMDAATPDIVATDINLGSGLTGLELADRVHGVRPDLPVVFVSGGLHGVGGRALASFEAFLPKPFDVEELVAVARRLTGMN